MNVLVLMVAAAADPTVIAKADLPDAPLIFSDGKGHTIVAFETGPVFYGDGTTFFESRSQNNGNLIYRMLIDPRHLDESAPSFSAIDAAVKVDGDLRHLTVTCGRRDTTLPRLDEATSAAVMQRAVFKRSPQDADPHALARGERGTFYYVERGRFEDNAESFRLFVGPMGALEPATIKRVVRDSKQEVFTTAAGELTLPVTQEGAAEWRHGKRRQRLTMLPVGSNQRMIFNELGVYAGRRLGTPCDDL